MAQAVEPLAEGPGKRPEGADAPRQSGELEPLAVAAERVGGASLSKEKAVYPRVVKRVGEAPLQYPDLEDEEG